jgi:cation/acetate symporter
MSSEVYQKIRSNPHFGEMVARRSRFAWTLSAIVLVLYFSFIMVVAFNPTFLATPLFSGSTTTIAIPLGVGMVFLFWVMTGIYIRRANGEFDEMTSRVIKEALK